MPNNLEFGFNQQGLVETNDEELNRIIRAVEAESGSKLGMAIPAITFEGTDPDAKIYLLLLSVYSYDESSTKMDDDMYRDWKIVTGRQATYDYLKLLIKTESIDPTESFIIAGDPIVEESMNNKEDVKFETKPITVYRFLKVMKDSNKVLDDGEDFDIDEYDPADYIHGDKTILDF